MAGPVGRCDGMLQFTGRIEKSRAEGRRLLKEAGAESLSFQLLNRNVDQPFKYVATWLIDEWGSPNLRLFDIKCAWSWIDPDEMERWLWAQPDSINFGDIYARLLGNAKDRPSEHRSTRF